MLLSQWVIVQKIVGRLDVGARGHARAHHQAVRGHAHARGRLGHARRGRALRLHDGARLRGAAPARPAAGASAVRAGARLAAVAAGRRVRDPDVGQVLAVDDRALRVRGRQSDPARAVPAARLGAAAPEQLLLPHALHLSRHRATCTGVVSTPTSGRSATSSVESSMRGEYGEIDFAKHRHDIAPSDLHVRPSLPLRAIYDALVQYEKHPVQALRDKALAHCFARIVYEQEASRGQGLSPVNGLLELPGAVRRAPSALRVVAGGDGVVEVGGRGRGHPLLRRALDLVGHGVRHARDARGAGARAGAHDAGRGAAARRTAGCATRRCRRSCPGTRRERREPIRGGWCFSDGVHRWPV